MSKGFEALDDAGIKTLEARPQSHKKLLLLRLPQEIKLRSLQGASINLNAVNKDQPLPSADGDIETKALVVEGRSLSHSICPLIRDRITKKAVIGDSISKTISAKRIFKFNDTPAIHEVGFI